MTAPYRLHEADTSAPSTRRLLEALFRRTFPGRDMIPFDGHWYLVTVEPDNQPAAFAAWCPSKHVEGAAYMSRCGVLPLHRGKGLHGWMLAARERSAEAAGFRVLVSCANRDNPASCNNFIEAGYRVFWPQVPWDDERAVYFRKALS